ncbi:MAG: DUF3793 family protein [Sphaerochaeta sp.]|jgi:hypothetical protein|nr:DUF3793 family protein [Sphaerochaeta sp.]MCH3919123.1 DUF3793 family protein [Sphaerochaeta sp.]MCI2046005.1 DUF3793 family protein [Sphaerochaeta sp.]MCI2077054.1 DUF3793 family protein [Sphaerochaeta sp.]
MNGVERREKTGYGWQESEERMLDELLVRFASPTLAGLKTGNLFPCPDRDEEGLRHSLRDANRRLGPKGVRVLYCRCHDGRLLVYVYRPKRLSDDWKDSQAKRLLLQAGYCPDGMGSCVRELLRRLASDAPFPHEVGLFLGYPPEDVTGFIQHKAQNCKCVGCWKVYGDEQRAKRLFRQFGMCTECYHRALSCGTPLERLVVGFPEGRKKI